MYNNLLDQWREDTGNAHHISGCTRCRLRQVDGGVVGGWRVSVVAAANNAGAPTAACRPSVLLPSQTLALTPRPNRRVTLLLTDFLPTTWLQNTVDKRPLIPTLFTPSTPHHHGTTNTQTKQNRASGDLCCLAAPQPTAHRATNNEQAHV